MKIKTSILALFCVLFVIGCSSMKSTDLINSVLPSGGYDKKTVKYGSLSRQSADVYIPKVEQVKTPIVFIFGGAWRDGSKEDFEFVAHALTGLGHSVIIPDYRLFPEVKFPDFVNDVADSVSFIEKNAQDILDKPLTEFILMGHSSGAHKASLLATDNSYFKSRGITAKVTGLIGMAGPYDLDLENNEVSPVFANSTRKQTNPLLNISAGMSPVLLLHGEREMIVFFRFIQRDSRLL